MCMFDKFHLTFNFKSKASRDSFKNKNEHQLTYTSNSKMSPQFWVTQYFRKTNILNNQITIFICNKKTQENQDLIIEHKYPSNSYVSPNNGSSLIHSIHFKPTHKDPHKSLKGLQVQPIVQMAFDCILFGNSSHK